MVTVNKTSPTITVQRLSSPSVEVQAIEYLVTVQRAAKPTLTINKPVRGSQGPKGDRGPPGIAGDIDSDLPDFTLIFDNRII